MPHDVAFGRIAATVAVTDMTRSLAFHTEVLGMRRTFQNGDPVGFVKGLRDADFGLRTFVFADPDGNRIDVGQQL